jgi:hypothetical protein
MPAPAPRPMQRNIWRVISGVGCVWATRRTSFISSAVYGGFSAGRGIDLVGSGAWARFTWSARLRSRDRRSLRLFSVLPDIPTRQYSSVVVRTRTVAMSSGSPWARAHAPKYARCVTCLRRLSTPRLWLRCSAARTNGRKRGQVASSSGFGR